MRSAVRERGKEGGSEGMGGKLVKKRREEGWRVRGEGM